VAVTHRFDLADAQEAYRAFDDREAVKVLLSP
jgi:threonine dehydrogenase-like Zn-dependent dehydrogenase